MPTSNPFPDPPSFSNEEIDRCRKLGDFCPVLFEWYKYVAITTNLIACIERDSPAIRTLPSPHFAALIGLLNRCSRLMLANVELSHNGLFGETTALVDRCIFESSIRVLWLCKQDSDEAFIRYFAEGLKTELALKAEISERITERGGSHLQIEERMIKSIDRYLATAALTEAQISASKNLPNLASMIDSLGMASLAYIVGQKIGSHHVHGTWPSLLLHYLEWKDDGTFHPRDHNCPTHVNQFVFVPLLVLSALKAFCDYLMQDPNDATPFLDLLESIEQEILGINNEVIGRDFDATQKI